MHGDVVRALLRETVFGAVMVLLPIDDEDSVQISPTTWGVLIDTLCVEPLVMVAQPPDKVDTRTSACQRMTPLPPWLCTLQSLAQTAVR